MIGILLISHGNFSVGIKNSAEMFFSNSIDAFDAIAYNENISLEQFDELLKNKIQELDDGSGIVILGDLAGGTPINRSISLLNDDVYLIAGFNFNLLIDLLIKRKVLSHISELNLHDMIEEAKSGMIFINELLEVL
ncbi:PTS sugar transporter subunit IIA [Dielma fastidiosa]|uniref:PTS EIIA type-4 domain-containing protein n=1 Tax=Dielma fastidiosa TaxID=1034346 RepID=A0AB35UKY3_9FIRM|nr:hypothetical protein [Dielma fastidiosa]MDY5167390.1 hypothetical protein [Dielma fastidiosa]